MAKQDGEATIVKTSGYLNMLMQMQVVRKDSKQPFGESLDTYSTFVEVITKNSHTGGLEVVVYFKINGSMIGPTILHAIWTPEELAEILG